MNEVLLGLYRHKTWTTLQVLRHCQTLPEESATVAELIVGIETMGPLWERLTLGARGLDVPELGVWEYAFAIDQMFAPA